MEDAEEMYRGWASDPEVTRYLIWSPHETVAETESYLRFVGECWSDESEYTWLICLKDGGAPIGTISLKKEGFKAGMGYALSRQRWNKGFMTEVAYAVLDAAFSDDRLYRVSGVCDVENLASARLMEKVGMSREGTLKNWLIHPGIGDVPRDCLSYSVTRQQPMRDDGARIIGIPPPNTALPDAA